MRIKRKDSIALVIDIQEKLLPVIHGQEKIKKNIKRLLQGLRALQIQIIVSEQYIKGLGPTVQEIESIVKNVPHHEKLSFSCLGEAPLRAEIISYSKNQVIIVGIETHVCVLQTALDLLEEGFQPIIIEDCVGSRNPNDKVIAIERLRSAGAIISSYESILFELCEKASTEEFKIISKLIK